MIGIDTGFIVELILKDKKISDLWVEIINGQQQAAISFISLFELEKMFLKGKLNPNIREIVFDAIKANCSVLMLNDLELAFKAARISHGTGIHASDALILASLIEWGAKKIYTTDEDLLNYKKRELKIINIRN